jgi:hypothetical protein
MNTSMKLITAVASILCLTQSLARADQLKMTGTVLDANTKLPLDGAYVVAIHEEWHGNIGMSTHLCVKLRGTTTGPDGRYEFPVEKPDGISPSAAIAIKPGYYLDHLEGMPDARELKRQNPAAYANRNIYLAPQDPKFPKFSYSMGNIYCKHAKTRADAEPGIQYLRIVADELRRYAADKRSVSTVDDLIGDLEGAGR